MLPTNLTTNEVKDRAGAEVEFLRLSTLDRSVTFAKSGELPNLEDRLKVSHLETGSGSSARRRSACRCDLAVTGVDGTVALHSAYVVLDIPIGNVANYNATQDVLARLMSFVASDGGDTVIKYDGNGTGAKALINGTL